MKNRIKFAVAALVVVAAFGCSKDNDTEVVLPRTVVRKFIASFDDAATKTALGDGNEVLWNKGDSIFYLGMSPTGQFDGVVVVPESGLSVEMEIEMPENATHLWARYKQKVDKSRNGVYGVAPSKQDGKFQSLHVSTAYLNLSGAWLEGNELKFRNLPSLFKFGLSRKDIVMAKLIANDMSKINCGERGFVSANFDDNGNLISVSANGGRSAVTTIDLDGSGTYYIAVLPDETLKSGFTMVFYDRNGASIGKVTYEKPLEIKRSSIISLGNFDDRIEAFEQQNYPQKQDYVEHFAGLDMEMVYVDGGSFTMGATSGQEMMRPSVLALAKPVHRVTLSSFCIGKFEVTQSQYTKMTGRNPSYDPYSGKHPVEHVSWYDAWDFAECLSVLTGRNYRLPTEAEWEYAARGGRKSMFYTYSGSNSISAVAWYFGNCNRTAAVGSKSPNELGIYDMSGNVSEWCCDEWYLYSSEDAYDPIHLSSYGSTEDRVYRGGHIGTEADACQVAFRFSEPPKNNVNYVGFRLVAVP